MRKMKHSRQLGGTAGCSLRLIEASEYCGSCEEQRQDAKEIGKREVFLGNLWFTSRRLLEAVKQQGHEYFG